MNLGSDVHFDPVAIKAFAKQYYRPIAVLAIVALLGYTGYQISRVFAVQADAAYVTTQEAGAAKAPSLKSSEKVVTQLKQLESAGSTALPVAVGVQDPFSLSD